MPPLVHVVGGGLAGCEAAWQLAERGIEVVLREMRPARMTAAHTSDRLAEAVCSNTFKSTELTNAHGVLKAELRVLGSLILDARIAQEFRRERRWPLTGGNLRSWSLRACALIGGFGSRLER